MKLSKDFSSSRILKSTKVCPRLSKVLGRFLNIIAKTFHGFLVQEVFSRKTNAEFIVVINTDLIPD